MSSVQGGKLKYNIDLLHNVKNKTYITIKIKVQKKNKQIKLIESIWMHSKITEEFINNFKKIPSIWPTKIKQLYLRFFLQEFQLNYFSSRFVKHSCLIQLVHIWETFTSSHWNKGYFQINRTTLIKPIHKTSSKNQIQYYRLIPQSFFSGKHPSTS